MGGEKMSGFTKSDGEMCEMCSKKAKYGEVLDREYVSSEEYIVTNRNNVCRKHYKQLRKEGK